MKTQSARKPHVLRRPWVVALSALVVLLAVVRWNESQSCCSYPSDTTSQKVNAPIGAQAEMTPSSQSIYK